MATSYRTPGVYVEEISKFPPSVAEVQTAIPAFIGYTEKASKDDTDLKFVPTRITSLLEYEQYYGGGPAYVPSAITADPNSVTGFTCTITNSQYVLYDSMRLFFDNGGGACYVISVGGYSDPITPGDVNSGLQKGLGELKKYDEPTLILFPDAVALDAVSLGNIQQLALAQCADLGDRFALLDVKADDEAVFRNNIGMNNLSYGAAYLPMLKTVYTKKFRFRDINPKLSLKSLVKDSDTDEKGVSIKSRITELEKVIADNKSLGDSLAAYIGSGVSLQAIYTSRLKTFNDDKTAANLKPVFNLLWEIILNIDGLLFDYVAAAVTKPAYVKTLPLIQADLLTSVTDYVTNTVKKQVQVLIDLDAQSFTPGSKKLFNSANTYTDYSVFQSVGLKSMVATTVDPPVYITAANLNEKAPECTAVLTQIFYSINNAVKSIVGFGTGYEDMKEKAVIPYIPAYKSIITSLNTLVTTVPPSGAIAGVIASVDNERGVWKAPANVSLTSIQSVTKVIDDAAQENLNIDPDTGKSVNAIRPFYGKGILVWGARTLAGNDNEWRYVSVRRLFNFVEESCKKSTSWVVFEPNDANTWARLRGQIENFLNNLWRRGALAGAKPEHAYYVNAGLGITMTPQDILEGRLIVEIGMAAVRPAEFIILRFSHKMQQS